MAYEDLYSPRPSFFNCNRPWSRLVAKTEDVLLGVRKLNRGIDLERRLTSSSKLQSDDVDAVRKR